MSPAGEPMGAAPAAESSSPATEAQLATAKQTVEELLTLLESPGTLHVKPMPDGSISVAMELSSELPGAPTGKRSQVLEALQFLVNKIVNKPGQERHWVSLGLGGHPEPRAARLARSPLPPAPSTDVPKGNPLRGGPSEKQRSQPSRVPVAPLVPVEDPSPASLADPALESHARALAEASAKYGRFMALVGMRPEERALVLKVVGAVTGVDAKLEGEGRTRRVVLTPANPTPMPKRSHLPEDDEADS